MKLYRESPETYRKARARAAELGICAGEIKRPVVSGKNSRTFLPL